MMRRQCLLGMAAALLAACTTLPKRQVRGIVLNGRFSLRYVERGSTKQQGESGQFAFEYDQDHVVWSLDAPTGQTVAELEWLASGQTTLRRLDHPEQSSAHPDLLTQQLFGWPLPVLWLTKLLQSTDLLPAEIIAHGWQLNVIERFDNKRPKRIQLTWLTPDERMTSLSLILLFNDV